MIVTVSAENFTRMGLNFDYFTIVKDQKEEKIELVILGRGENREFKVLLPEKPVIESIQDASSLFDSVVNGEGLIATLADISRGNDSGKICYDLNGEPIHEQMSQLRATVSHLVKAYKAYVKFLESAKQRQSTPVR